MSVKPNPLLIVVGLAVIVASGLTGLMARHWSGQSRGPLRALLVSELAPTDPRYREVMCGPDSLSVGLARLGISLPPAVIAGSCRVTDRGVALTDLERVAAETPGLRAQARRLTWNELVETDGVAVLFVGGNHYVVADPRERTTAADTVRVYDRDVPARAFTRGQLEAIWSGEALVVTRAGSPGTTPSVPGPRLAWNECYVDRGVITNASTVSYAFTLRNEGTEPLQIHDMRVSCGCTKPRLSSRLIPPGGSAQVDVDVNLTGRQGYNLQTLTIATNDPAHPESWLRMACAVPRDPAVSARAIRLDDIIPGGSARLEFVVADAEFTGLTIREGRYVARGTTPAALTCAVTWQRVGDDAKTVADRTGYPAAPGDALVRLEARATDHCPATSFEGDVVIEAIGTAPGSPRTYQVGVQGQVVSDVLVSPKMALLTLGPEPDAEARVSLRLKSRSDRPLRVVRAWVEPVSPVARGTVLDLLPHPTSAQGRPVFEVRARVPDLARGAPPLRAHARLELSDGSLVEVPVTVFRPPPQ